MLKIFSILHDTLKIHLPPNFALSLKRYVFFQRGNILLDFRCVCYRLSLKYGPIFMTHSVRMIFRHAARRRAAPTEFSQNILELPRRIWEMINDSINYCIQLNSILWFWKKAITVRHQRSKPRQHTCLNDVKKTSFKCIHIV